MDIYREQILDHYKHPRNFGHLEKADVTVEDHNVSCGDKIVIELHTAIHDSRLTIRDIRFSGEGCAISQASASMLTEKVLSGASHPEQGKGSRPNMSLGDIMKLTPKDIMEMLGTTLTPSRVKCAMLSLEVLQKAVTAIKK